MEKGSLSPSHRTYLRPGTRSGTSGSVSAREPKNYADIAVLKRPRVKSAGSRETTTLPRTSDNARQSISPKKRLPNSRPETRSSVLDSRSTRDVKNYYEMAINKKPSINSPSSRETLSGQPMPNTARLPYSPTKSPNYLQSGTRSSASGSMSARDSGHFSDKAVLKKPRIKSASLRDKKTDQQTIISEKLLKSPRKRVLHECSRNTNISVNKANKDELQETFNVCEKEEDKSKATKVTLPSDKKQDKNETPKSSKILYRRDDKYERPKTPKVSEEKKPKSDIVKPPTVFPKKEIKNERPKTPKVLEKKERKFERPKTPLIGDKKEDKVQRPKTPQICDKKENKFERPKTPLIGDKKEDKIQRPKTPQICDKKENKFERPKTPLIGDKKEDKIQRPKTPQICDKKENKFERPKTPLIGDKKDDKIQRPKTPQICDKKENKFQRPKTPKLSGIKEEKCESLKNYEKKESKEVKSEHPQSPRILDKKEDKIEILKTPQIFEINEEKESLKSPEDNEIKEDKVESPKTMEVVTIKDDKHSSITIPKSARETRNVLETISRRPRIKSAGSSHIPRPIPRIIKPGSAPSKVIEKAKRDPPKINTETKKPTTETKRGPSKYVLEMQFEWKKKKLTQMQKEVLEKQKPILVLYENLIHIKKKLDELGEIATLDELVMSTFSAEGVEEKRLFPVENTDSSETVIISNPSTVHSQSFEEITKLLIDMSKKLLTKRNVLVELLEGITKSEVNVEDLSDRMEALKMEGVHFQSKLNVVVDETHTNINKIMKKWQILIEDKTTVNTTDEEIKKKLQAQTLLYEESKQVIEQLKKQLDDKNREQYVTELNNIIRDLKEKIKKLEQDLDTERKHNQEFKGRHGANNTASKSIKSKIIELENEMKTTESENAELTRKIKFIKDQMREKEEQWHKEKETIKKTIKEQENLMQEMTAENMSFESKVNEMQEKTVSTEDFLRNEIAKKKKEIEELRINNEKLIIERDREQERYKEMCEQISLVGNENKETLHTVSHNIDWGMSSPQGFSNDDNYSETILKDIIIEESLDEMKRLEREIARNNDKIEYLKNNKRTRAKEERGIPEGECILKYEKAIAVADLKLSQETEDLEKVTAEYKQLLERQMHIEATEGQYPVDDIKELLELGRVRLSKLGKQDLENEQIILTKEKMINEGEKKIQDLENLLKEKDVMAKQLIDSRCELFSEKQSLTKYSQELKTMLAEVTEEDKKKDAVIEDLQKKISAQERKINRSQREVKDLQENMRMVNAKRFKLQESVQNLEKELQLTKAVLAATKKAK